MMTKIEWAEKTWNPVTGCTPISEGCQRCYAKVMANRLHGMGKPKYRNNFEVTTHPQELDKPLHWKKPSRVFVCSMSDLFHDDVPDKFILDVWHVMAQNPQHTFQLLTKRPERALVWAKRHAIIDLPHVWWGVTAENQKRADERIPVLLQIPAAVRFVSVEPMLGPVNLTIRYNAGPGLIHNMDSLRGYGGWGDYDRRKYKINWVICGGESGPGARPMHPDWARKLRDQCVEAGVPFFFKQWGAYRYVPNDEDSKERMADAQVSLENSCMRWTPGLGRVSLPEVELYSAFRVGKKKAGRLLDGREWSQYPEVKP